MKQLFTLALAFACLSAHSQSGLMPYNPDSNGDALIGSEDLISLLGVYNTLMIDSSLTCDYEGTEFEEFIVGLVDASLVLDSIYVEYLIYDTLSYYLPGCPDLVYEPVVLERSYMMTNANYQVNIANDIIEVYANSYYLNFTRSFVLQYYGGNNRFHMAVRDFEVEIMTSYFHFSEWADLSGMPFTYQPWVLLPFPDGWHLDGDGIQIDWAPGNWAGDCEHFRLIPYWHEAE